MEMCRERRTLAKAPRDGVGDEGEGEVGGLLDRAGFRGGAVGRPDGEESSVYARSDEPEDCRGAEGPEAAEEPGLGDDAAEGGAGGGGAGEVGCGVEAQEDVLPNLVREDGLRRRASGGPPPRGRPAVGENGGLWRSGVAPTSMPSRRRPAVGEDGGLWRSGVPPTPSRRGVGRLWERSRNAQDGNLGF